MAQGGSTSATSTASSSGYQPISHRAGTAARVHGSVPARDGEHRPAQQHRCPVLHHQCRPVDGTQQALDFGYTIIGQLVAGQQTLVDLSKVAVQNSSTGELSLPINPVTINSATLSPTNTSGVVHVDTTSARAGETAHITVTATDPADGTQVSRVFTIAVSAYNGPTQPLINFKPFATGATATTDQDVATTIAVTGQSGFPDTNYPGTLTYAIVTQPAHGTISQFDATTGRLVYTPAPGYSGTDSFQYQVTGAGPWSKLPNTVSSTGDRQYHDQRETGSHTRADTRADSAPGDPERCRQDLEQTAPARADRLELQRRGERGPGPANGHVPPGITWQTRVVHRPEREGHRPEIGPL